MTGKNVLGELDRAAEDVASTEDDQFLVTISAYLDGELRGKELADFEERLKNSKALAREIAEMRALQDALRDMGAEILRAPLPESLLEVLSRALPNQCLKKSPE